MTRTDTLVFVYTYIIRTTKYKSRILIIHTGILPRDGRNISFRDLNTRCHETFNFSPTFSFYVPHYAATMLERNYWTDTFDLADLSAHNCIEHDASLCRASPSRPF